MTRSLLASALCASAHSTATAEEVSASHATVLPQEPPEWVQLLPAGTFRGLDGRGPYRIEDPAEVIRLTREMTGGNDLPIDYGHALERAGHEGDAAPAAGWISELEIRDGQVWGKVAWTEEGARRVRSREYRYLSPVFMHPKEGDEKRVLFLLRAGLTNRPNLVMRSVNSQHSHTENRMKELLERIAVALGLSKDADEAAVLAQCSTLAGVQTELVKVAQSVELGEKATGAEIVAAVQQRSKVDPAKYVPIELHQQVATALQAAQKKDAEAVVDAAIRAGKLIPAQREWALSYHGTDPQGFAAFVEKQPVVVTPGAESRRDAAEGGGQLDEEEKAICASLGIAEEDFVKNRKG